MSKKEARARGLLRVKGEALVGCGATPHGFIYSTTHSAPLPAVQSARGRANSLYNPAQPQA